MIENDCKINHENSFENMREKMFLADVYLVELSDRFSVISCSSSSRKLVRSGDFSEILSFKNLHLLRKYLFSYGVDPIVIPTFIGNALILPNLYPSSRLFMVVFFKNEKKDALIRVASSKRFEGRVGFFEQVPQGRIRKWDEPLAEQLDFALNIANDISENSLFNVIDTRESIVEKSNLLFENISYITGVKISLDIDDDVLCDDCFDAKLFSAFLLTIIMLCRKSSKDKLARVRLFQKNFGLSVMVTFDSGKKLSRYLNPEIAHFNAISDANNMIFESSFSKGSYEVAFTPARKDWSLLELKLPIDIIN